MNSTRVEKIRLDRLLVERGLAATRQKAQALILAGQVLVDEQKMEKCGTAVSARGAAAPAGNRVQSMWGAAG